MQKAFSIENRRFGRYLRSVRESRRLSLDAVEEMSTGYPERITKSHLSRIENGQAVPTFPRMFALSEIYGVPVSSMAERFEIDLKHGMLSAAIEGKSREEAEEEARKARLKGHFRDAIGLYEYMLDKFAGDASTEEVIDWRLRRAFCLIGLERHNSAKEEFEYLLNHQDLTSTQKIQALECFTRCCRHTSRFTVALMAIEQAKRESAEMTSLPINTRGSLATIHGEVLFDIGRFEDARQVFNEALSFFQDAGHFIETIHTKINLGVVLTKLGNGKEAKQLFDQSLEALRGQGHDRMESLALSGLAKANFEEGNLDSAESLFIRSNSIARIQEYTSIVFMNCFYLWRIGAARGDRPTIAANEKTLRTLLRRVSNIEEAELFRAHLSGVKE